MSHASVTRGVAVDRTTSLMDCEPLARDSGHAADDGGWARSVAAMGTQIARARKGEGLLPVTLVPPAPASSEKETSSEWTTLLSALLSLAQKPNATPSWWVSEMPFRASLQTWTALGVHGLAGTAVSPDVQEPATHVHITLAGWGQCRGQDGQVRVSGPGNVHFGSKEELASSLSLPEESPRWTFARIEISHPYFQHRIAEQAGKLGQSINIGIDDTLTSSLLRLVRSEILKGFHEPADAERALFDFVLSFEQWARRKADGTREIERLMEETRACVVAKLPKAIDVGTLAARFGMSRCHFSHYFRRVTGMTPGRFATEIRLHKVEEMLLETREPLKIVADACGFANPNHLCKVFRRHRQITPTVFRQRAR
jgi:AraC-like DNA-binding protein